MQKSGMKHLVEPSKNFCLEHTAEFLFLMPLEEKNRDIDILYRDTSVHWSHRTPSIEAS